MNTVLGAMTFARQVDEERAIELIRCYMTALGISASAATPTELRKVEIDSAFMYPARETMTLTEQLLGQIFLKHAEWHAMRFASKANPCAATRARCVPSPGV